MASPIRPNFPELQSTVRPPRSSEAARAAQRAFFDAALNKAQASEPQPAATAPARPPAAPNPVSPPTESPSPDRLMRPGSLLNIRV